MLPYTGGDRLQKDANQYASQSQVVLPGDRITADAHYMRGHGTTLNDQGQLVATVAGSVERVNRLVSVRAPKPRYRGQIGDVIVGRVVELGTKRWQVETGAALLSVLHLSAVNLPGGELRRRSDEDEKMMREYLQEGDLISAEIQSIFHDGSLALHTRSLKYGRLGQGVLVPAPSHLIQRSKTHFHNLPCGASVIFGVNGFVWVSPEAADQEGGFQLSLAPVGPAEREVTARLVCCVKLLAAAGSMLFDTSLLHAFEASTRFPLNELGLPSVMDEIASLTKLQLEMQS